MSKLYVYFIVGLVLVLACVHVIRCSQIHDGQVVLVPGKRITSVMMTSQRRSRITCASACLNENDVGQTCMTATFDGQTGKCELSTGLEQDMTSSGDDHCTGIIVTRPLPTPPPPTTAAAPSGGSGGSGGAGGGNVVHTQYGRSFVFVFTQNNQANVVYRRISYVDILSEETTEVHIRYQDINETVTLSGATVLEHQFHTSVTPASPYDTAFIAQTGVEITSNKDIAVFAISREAYSGGGSLIIPEVALGTSYIVHTLCSHPGTEVHITGTTDGTDVTIDRPDGYTDDVIAINRLDVYKLGSCSLAPPGTLIVSTHPVAVQIGHDCAYIPYSRTTSCEHIMTSLLPVEKLNTIYIIPDMYPRVDFSIGLVSPTADTVVDIYDADGNVLQSMTMSLQESQLLLFAETLVIVSTRPILVVQYGNGDAVTTGDPSVTMVPPPEHFTNVYSFSIPLWYSPPSIVCVIVHSDHASGVRVNEATVTPQLTSQVTIPGTVDSYQLLYLPMSSHGVSVRLHHTDPQVNFGAFLYARKDWEEYVTVLGFKF